MIGFPPPTKGAVMDTNLHKVLHAMLEHARGFDTCKLYSTFPEGAVSVEKDENGLCWKMILRKEPKRKRSNLMKPVLRGKTE